MNKKRKIISIALTVLFLSSAALYARMKNWNWRAYKLKFKLHQSMRPTVSNSSQFIAKGHGLVFKIQPYKRMRRGYTAKKLADYGYRTYTILKRKRILSRSALDSRRYMIYGTGYYKGRKAYFGLFGVSSTTSRRGVYARVWWFANSRYAASNKAISYKIARSVYFHK